MKTTNDGLKTTDNLQEELIRMLEKAGSDYSDLLIQELTALIESEKEKAVRGFVVWQGEMLKRDINRIDNPINLTSKLVQIAKADQMVDVVLTRQVPEYLKHSSESGKGGE